MRAKLLLVAAALLLASVGTVGAAPFRSDGCKPGQTKVDGKRATRFCGAATAAIHVGHFWFRLRGGSCAATSKLFTVNIGTVVVAPNQKLPYFGLTLGQYPGAPKSAKPAGKDGVYTEGVVVVRWHGGAWDVNGRVKITLKHHRHAGTFSGATTFSPHTKVSGAFSC
jgi:hypothetical protein